jgi:hypothetical protein
MMAEKTTVLYACITVALLAAALPGASDDTFASSGYARGAAEYLRLPLHGDCAALAGAVTAWSANLTGLQYNPAVLDAVHKGTVGIAGTYRILTLDRGHMGAHAAMSLGDYVAVALSIDDYTVGNIEGRDQFGVKTRDFDYREGAAALTVAGRLMWPISVGGTVRYLYGDMLDERANGLGFDLGAVWDAHQYLRVGLSGRHVGSFLWWSTGHRDIVLPTARAGAAGLFLDTTLIAELDIVKPLRQPIDVLFGVQYELLDLIYFRGGIATSVHIADRDSRKPDFSLGVGMRYRFFGFDYALEIPSSQLGPRHTVTVIGWIRLGE